MSSDNRLTKFLLVMSCLMLWEITNPTAGFFSHVSVNFALTFWSISIGTTLLLTTLIVVRLLITRFRVHKALADMRSHSAYLSVSATLIESAFLYSVVALPFVITFAKNSLVQNLFLPLLGQVQVRIATPASSWQGYSELILKLIVDI